MRIFRAAKPRLLLGVLDGGSLERRVLRLLDTRLPWARRWRAAAAACCAVVMAGAAVSLGMFGMRASVAQKAAGEKQAFEVASIRLNDPRNAKQDYMSNNQPRPYPANRVTMRYITLKSLVNEAFGASGGVSIRVVGGPAWIDQQHYDLNAKVPGDALLTEDQMRPMVRNLLEERFHLKYHREDKVVPGYALVVAKGGPKLQPTKGDPFGGINSYFEFNYKNVSVENFGKAIAVWQVKQPVVDKTGIQGNYDIDLKFAPEGGPPKGSPFVDDPRNTTLPDIFTAVQEQLGLKLVPQKVTVHTLVIDYADRVPTEN